MCNSSATEAMAATESCPSTISNSLVPDWAIGTMWQTNPVQIQQTAQIKPQQVTIFCLNYSLARVNKKDHILRLVSGQNVNEKSSTNQLKYTVLRNKVFNINQSAEHLVDSADSNASSTQQQQQNASGMNSINANSNKLTYLKRYVANSLTSKFTDGNWNRIPGSKLKASNPNRTANMTSLANANSSNKNNANLSYFQSHLNINTCTPSNSTNAIHSNPNGLVNNSLNNPNSQSTKSNLNYVPPSAYLSASNRELTIIDLQLPIKPAVVSQSTNGGTQSQHQGQQQSHGNHNHHMHHSFTHHSNQTGKQHRVNLISAKNSFNYDYYEPNHESTKSLNNGGAAKSPSKILIATVIKPHITSLIDASNSDPVHDLASNTYDIAFNSSNENYMDNSHTSQQQQHHVGEFTSNYVNKNLNYFKYVMHQQKKRQISSSSDLHLNSTGQQAVGLTSTSLNTNNNTNNGSNSGKKQQIQIHQHILPLHSNLVNNALTSNTLLIKRLKWRHFGHSDLLKEFFQVYLHSFFYFILRLFIQIKCLSKHFL